MSKIDKLNNNNNLKKRILNIKKPSNQNYHKRRIKMNKIFNFNSSINNNSIKIKQNR